MEWTILFVVHGLDEGLKESSDELVWKTLQKGKWALSDINLLYVKSETDHPGHRQSINALLYKINSLQDKNNGLPDQTLCQTFPDVNIGNAKTMTAIFSYVRKEFPATKTMVIIFDHGAGFGIYKPIPEIKSDGQINSIEDLDNVLAKLDDWQVEEYTIPKTASLPVEPMDPGADKDISDKDEKSLEKFMVYDEVLEFYRAHTDMLTMEELSEAIAKGFDKKIDVLVLVNCNMQMLETSYTLRNNVRYLVACETLFWRFGINYQAIIGKLDSTAMISPEAAAIHCVTTLEERYEKINKMKLLKDAGLSAIELEKMEPVYTRLREFFAGLVNDVPKVLPAVTTARKEGADLSQFNYTASEKRKYEPLFFYDLAWFLKNIPGAEQEAKDIAQLLARAVRRQYIGSDFVRGTEKMINGCSLFFPFYKIDFTMKYYGLFYKPKAKFKTDFSSTEWGDFLAEVKNIRG